MLRIVLVRPGATDFDDQGRIKGRLDIPLNDHGLAQVATIVREVSEMEIDAIYTAPCQAAQATAVALAESRRIKVKELDQLRNLDHGLWQGRLLEEVRQTQPRVYRQWQEHPETICPPEGETLGAAQHRIQEVIAKLLRRHRDHTIAVVAPEPLASLIEWHLEHKEFGDIWKTECRCGRWQLLDVEPQVSIQSK